MPLNESYFVRICDLVLYFSSLWFVISSGVNHGLHVVLTLHSMGWQEYSMDAFVPRLYYCFYCIILHSSHLCWSFWDFQMPVDRFSKIKMVVGFFFWESYIYIYIYIYIGRVCCILFRVNGSKRPHWSSWSGICYVKTRFFLLPFTLKYLKLSTTKIFVVLQQDHLHLSLLLPTLPFVLDN